MHAQAHPWWRRLGRQLTPRRTQRDCCNYHRADWHKVSKTAIRFLREAKRAGIAPIGWDEEFCAYIGDRAKGEGITGCELEALESLFLEPIGARAGAGVHGGLLIHAEQHESPVMALTVATVLVVVVLTIEASSEPIRDRDLRPSPPDSRRPKAD